MPNPLSDRNLLLGVLALQFGLVSRDQLVDAISAWGSDKSQPLDEIFVRQKAITLNHRQVMTSEINNNKEIKPLEHDAWLAN